MICSSLSGFNTGCSILGSARVLRNMIGTQSLSIALIFYRGLITIHDRHGITNIHQYRSGCSRR